MLEDKDTEERKLLLRKARKKRERIKYYAKHRSTIRAKALKAYAENKEARCAYQRKVTATMTPQQRESRRLKAKEKRRLNPEKAREKSLECSRKRQAKGLCVPYRKAYREKHPHRKKAEWYLHEAIRKGELFRGPCQICGNPESIGHHDSYFPENYTKVTWFCERHHRAWHEIFLVEEPQI